MTHAGGPSSNPGVPQLWRLVTLKPLKLQQCTLHFWKPLIFFYLDKRGQGHSYVLNTQKVLLKIPGFTIVYLLGQGILKYGILTHRDFCKFEPIRDVLKS